MGEGTFENCINLIYVKYPRNFNKLKITLFVVQQLNTYQNLNISNQLVIEHFTTVVNLNMLNFLKIQNLKKILNFTLGSAVTLEKISIPFQVKSIYLKKNYCFNLVKK